MSKTTRHLHSSIGATKRKVTPAIALTEVAEGMSYILDLTPVDRLENASRMLQRDADTIDREALLGDWYRVGDDVRASAEKFRRQHKIKCEGTVESK